MHTNKKKFKKVIIITILLFIIVILTISIKEIYGSININMQSNTINSSITIEEAEEKNKTITEMLQQNMPTVVGISKIRNNGTSVLGVNNVSELGLGSGVIISTNGYILTNEHVSGNKYSTCYITLENGKILTGNVVWSDEKLDLAIIKVNQKFSYSATLGDSENIQIGENVYAIGNPIGVEFQRTVTSGIISATNRTITFEENGEKIYMDSLIQTDATINPGNSGGPLLNIYGEIIGINTVKITSAEGIGFAVPINIIKPILNKLDTKGEFIEASIGILAYDSNIAKYANYDIKIDTGVYVLENVSNNSNIRPGDNIIKMDGKEIKKINDLRQYVYTKEPGDTVNLTIIRNKKEEQISVQLGKK